MPYTLYYGDNLEILRQHVADGSVDLVDLDPPFNSNASYNLLFRERSGEFPRPKPAPIWLSPCKKSRDPGPLEWLTMKGGSSGVTDPIHPHLGSLPRPAPG